MWPEIKGLPKLCSLHSRRDRLCDVIYSTWCTVAFPSDRPTRAQQTVASIYRSSTLCIGMGLAPPLLRRTEAQSVTHAPMHMGRFLVRSFSLFRDYLPNRNHTHRDIYDLCLSRNLFGICTSSCFEASLSSFGYG